VTSPSFIDEVRIWVKGGDGGAGCVSFRRETFVPRGGPDGGNGGSGGDVYLVGKRGLSSLHHFRRQRHFRAERGLHGGSNDKTGRSGEHTYVDVPLGTIARDAEGALLGEILEPGQKLLVARGERGGRGNAAFKSSTNRAPRQFDPGRYAEERELRLELKLLADVAIIGLPNAGKSTLISRISAARPKIADYPFTTLVPNLGVVEAPGHQSFVVADVPGLIEGASEGHGLGLQFLRHVERSRVLLHLLDGTALEAEDPAALYRAVRRELEAYSAELAQKPEIVAVNKADAGLDEALLGRLRAEIGPLHVISAAAGEGLKGLVRELWTAVSVAVEAQESSGMAAAHGVGAALDEAEDDEDAWP
jgi:GTPase